MDQGGTLESAGRPYKRPLFLIRYSWVPGFFRGYRHALIFDEYNPKPCYYTIKAVMKAKL